MALHRPLPRPLALIAAGALGLLTLACQPIASLPVANGPRWACPSATPLPTRVKESVPGPTTTPGGAPATDEVYEQPWEREYGLPARTPTPYAKTGNSYLLGQLVEIWPLHVLVTARDGDVIGQEQLHHITITWLNHADAPLPMDYSTRVRLRAVRRTNGGIVSGDTWGISDASLGAAGVASPPTTIPVGESTVELPILGPPGTTEIVEVIFLAQNSSAFPVGTPPAVPTAADNADLQAPRLPLLTVQWSRGEPTPPCDNPGVITAWGDGRPVAQGGAAPSGARRVVQIALNQVGKPYIWGAKGPNAFDCSGLTQWSYGQVGIRIPAGTSGQWPGLPSVEQMNARPGDLIFFDTMRAGRVTHVGMLVGDLNGDGQWDMVHAATPEYGVRVDLSVFERPYYRSMYRGLRTVR